MPRIGIINALQNNIMDMNNICLCQARGLAFNLFFYPIQCMRVVSCFQMLGKGFATNRQPFLND